MSNTTTATFSAGQTEAVADTRLLQWAYGQVLRLEGLELPTSYQVDFSNTEYCGASVPKMGNSEGVQIPNKLLRGSAHVGIYSVFFPKDYRIDCLIKFAIPNKDDAMSVSGIVILSDHSALVRERHIFRNQKSLSGQQQKSGA